MSRTVVAPLGVSAALLGLSLAGFVSGTRVLASTAGVTNGRLPAAARGSGPDRDVPPSPCTVVVGDTVPGGPLPACRQTAVTVTLGVSCPLRLPLHLVLVVGNHLAMQDHLDEVKRAARAVVNGLDFDDGTMVAVVTLSAQARRQLDLTDRRAPVLAAINRIRLDPINPFVRYYNWIGEAERILEEGRQEGPPALEVIVVYSTGCPSGFESYCTRQIASAGKAKGGGITVIGVCNPNARPFGFPLPAGHCRTLQQMATSGYYHTLQQAGRTAMDLEDLAGSGKDLTVGALTFVESVAPRLRFVPGSAVPPAGEEGADLTFQWHDVSPGSVVTATYRLSPTTPGTATLRAAGSQVRLTDSLGRPGGPWPVARRILTFTTCAVATATPSPTALATPVPTEPAATATPLATATPRPGRLWLPVALHRACRPGLTPLDVVLAMDASTSMDASSGGTTKLAAAKAAAVAFVELLAPGRDRAAVVVFNHTATVVAPLGSDDAAVEAALAQVVSAPGTNIAAALARSRGVLVGRRRGAAAAMVLLTDGRPDPGTRDRVLVEAALAGEAGITVVAVGLGDGVDEDLLGRVASRPELYRSAGDADALAGLYAAMAAELPCPGGAMWQRPWESPPGRPEETGGPPAPDRLSSAPTPIPRPWGDAPSADVEASPIYGAVGGVIGAMATGGDTLYAGVGAKVLRYLPAGPGVAEDAASEVLSSVARDIALEGDRLLVAQGQALLVMDDAGAAGLEPVLGVSTLGRALRVAVEGGFAYVLVEGQPGVLVLDVGGPAPRGAGTGLPQVQGRDLAAGQRRLYVTTGDGLVVADVSMPGTPRMLGEIPGLPGAGAVEVARDRLYVAVDDGVWAFGTSGLAPEAGGFVPTGGRPVAMRVAGNTVVVSTDAGRLVAVDFAVADSPTVLGDVDLADSLGPVAVTAPDPGPGGAGARAYVGGARGIHVVALGADGLAESALVPGFEEAWDVALGDTAVYGALGDVGLGAFTFGPGRLLRLAGMVPLGGSARRVSSSSLHNWAAAVMDPGDVVVVDTAQPSAMAVTGRLAVAARDVDVASTFGFVAAGTEILQFTAGPGAGPTIVDREADPTWDLDAVVFGGNSVFASDRNFGLRVFSTDGAGLALIASLAFPPPEHSAGMALDLTPDYRRLHVAAGNAEVSPLRARDHLALALTLPPPALERVITIDVADLGRPRIVAPGSLFGWPRAIAASEGRRYVAAGLATGGRGRLMIQGRPGGREFGLRMPSVPRGVDAAGDWAQVAGGEAGILLVHNVHPVTPSPTATVTPEVTATPPVVMWRQYLPRLHVSR